ncbi:MAG: hypothetical protein ACXWED_01155 [Solirubrobacterales bacterium]
MSVRHRIVAAVLVCVLHLVLFVPTVGSWSSILVNDFAPQAEAIEGGDLPYRDQKLEYPPLSIPVLQAPALFGDGTDNYVEAFEWEMIGFDLAIVLVLALALPGRPREVVGALGVYTAGLVILSGVVLDDSLIDTAPLALARFDLVPTLLVLAAVFARQAGRSATWSVLLSAGVAVKTFPLALFPALLKGERQPRRVIAGALAVVAIAVAVVVVLGDTAGSDLISSHTNKGVQVETVPATPFEIAWLFGADVSSVQSAGRFNVDAAGVNVVRWISILAGIALYLVVLWRGWRARVRVSPLQLTTALIAVMLILPEFSPQFLLWLLPLSAAAYGLGRENLVLLAVLLFTQIELQHYDQAVGQFGAAFIWAITARNLYLFVYLWLVCAPIIRAGREQVAEPASPAPTQAVQA